ncbi:MAG TPA: hypothetical protein VGB16_02365 [candidate division Zixibacteria bacterium]
MAISDIISLVAAGLFLLLIFGFCAFVIKRYWIDKKQITSGSQFVSQNVYMQFQNEDKKQAMEQVLYQKEDEREEDDEGDDVSRSDKG